ncbi:ammonium transporter [Asticcacaulis sp. BYS171W]|uniref:Ammonium transporter n=1 Tax=Asticcacaulis aquaticus TaxID=2984212 RepID=A0ABT5HS49_9CAUL|nr:ammonium transporter [Asticcacaulis aquaticus]MDC7682763.1 ammonium transporter [Asticcacaulis aquaticus]
MTATTTNVVETAAPVLLKHQAALALDTGHTSWIIVSTALVLLMTLPGLALFYGGMVRKKNVLSVLAQSVAAAVIVSVLWIVIGYSLSFGINGNEGVNRFLGSFDAFLLNGVTMNTAFGLAPQLPEFLWVAYQMTFAIITPALIAGAFAERMKFSAFVLFTALWTLFVYAPICHWVWGGGFLGSEGVLDFAGGAVVHVNSGVAGLVCAIVLGKRRGFPREYMAPHNLAFTMIGASLLLVGWLGFNGGSAWTADALASVAVLNTIVAAMTGAIGWTIPEWIERKQPTVLGMISGLVAGLVAITPAAGFVDPKASLLIGLLGGVACFFGATALKKAFKYDDSLDAFGVHGVGGIVGAILTGVFANATINAAGENASVIKQALGLVAVIGWSALITFIILMICKYTTGLRVDEEQEIEGLDATQHGEAQHG